MKNIVEIIREELETRKDRSAWNKGVERALHLCKGPEERLQMWT